jgi:nicotinamidase-related amidase
MTDQVPDWDPRRFALVVVDVQRGFDDAAHWGRRDNPQCEENVGRLVAAWREVGAPVVFIRHDSVEPHSPLRPGTPGNDFKPVLTGQPDLLVTKSAHSAFHGSPDLDAWLRERDLAGLVVCGITTNHCCETTARVGADLGHTVLFVIDATHTFDRGTPLGDTVAAEMLARVTATNLDGEFATVVGTEELLTHAKI